MTVQSVPVEWLEPNPWNPNVMDPEKFEGLKADVVAGDYNPIIASPRNIFYGDPNLAGDLYVIVDGEHKWQAAVEADVGDVDVDVRDLNEAAAKVYCYRRNAFRGSMDPVKEGELFELDMKELGTEEAVAERYGRSRSYVAGRRSLVRLAEPVKELYRKPEETLVALKKEEFAEQIVEENPDEEYTEAQMVDMVDAALEETPAVPRGTLTASHMEAIVGLPETSQKSLAAKIVEENLTVRDTETVVRIVQERIARRARFEEALERAVQKTCPWCGSSPKDFEEIYTPRGELPRFNEDAFDCSMCWHDWDYMVDAKKVQEAAEKRARADKTEQSTERSQRLREAQVNPGYIRRAEDSETLRSAIAPWALRQSARLVEIRKIEFVGRREDGKVVTLTYPSSWADLIFRVGDPGRNQWWHAQDEQKFYLDIEAKTYKKLPFKSKIDLTSPPSPEHRAEAHWFFDEVVGTHQDPFLPEDEAARKKILAKYGELKEE